MGGHGGLNILPQKRWNVYRFDNQEKVRKDEEAAAKEEQLKREQSHKRDTEFRIEQLRQARGLASTSASAPASSSHPSATAAAEIKPSPEGESKSESKHINLFEGIRIFDPIGIKSDDKKNNKRELSREDKREFKRMKKEAETPKVVLPEDEKYRLGYGVAGKGVKLPWYMEKQLPKSPSKEVDSEKITKSSNIRKKSVEELREERLKREGKEKERERALLMQHKRNDRRGYSYPTRR